MHVKRFNLHKTNAANEELVISLKCGREVQERIRYTNCSYHSNSLSNKMDNFLLDAGDINHIYIVVEKIDTSRQNTLKNESWCMCWKMILIPL